MPRDLRQVLPRVGALVEGPAFYPFLSGVANLRRLDAADRDADRRTRGPRIEAALERVGLSNAAGKKIRAYSLGMKQRLGIAHALLGDPEVLVLDEPANGLDPAGIRWMRDLLRGYARRGGTVLLSSHLLHEVELVADDLVLIGRGRIVAHGDKESLSAGDASALVTARDNAELAAALGREGIAATPEGPGLRVAASTAEVSRVSVEHSVILTDLRSGARGLEDLFLDLTSSTQREDAAAPGSLAALTTSNGASR
jgi:ABC-2 type transport system ATP-binding protein